MFGIRERLGSSNKGTYLLRMGNRVADVPNDGERNMYLVPTHPIASCSNLHYWSKFITTTCQ